MVSRHPFIFAVVFWSLLGAFGCESLQRTEPTSNVVSSASQPLVLSVEPDAAGLGDSVTVSGRGFSYVAPENIISVSGTAQVADAYTISEDGTESISFSLSEEAVEGESVLIVIVEGRASNAFPFTVLPPSPTP